MNLFDREFLLVIHKKWECFDVIGSINAEEDIKRKYISNGLRESKFLQTMQFLTLKPLWTLDQDEFLLESHENWAILSIIKWSYYFMRLLNLIEWMTLPWQSASVCYTNTHKKMMNNSDEYLNGLGDMMCM